MQACISLERTLLRQLRSCLTSLPSPRAAAQGGELTRSLLFTGSFPRRNWSGSGRRCCRMRAGGRKSVWTPSGGTRGRMSASTGWSSWTPAMAASSSECWRVHWAPRAPVGLLLPQPSQWSTGIPGMCHRLPVQIPEIPGPAFYIRIEGPGSLFPMKH